METIEVFHGLKFWEAHGDGNDALGARKRATKGSLVDRFQYFSPEFLELGSTFCMTVDKTVVALAGCTYIDTASKSIGLQYVTVAVEHRGNGYSSKLCAAICEFARSHGAAQIACSPYSILGMQRVRSVLRRECKAAGLSLKDHPKAIG